MDVSLREAFDIAFGADFANFIELLYLSDIGIHAWVGMLIFAALFPLCWCLPLPNFKQNCDKKNR